MFAEMPRTCHKTKYTVQNSAKHMMVWTQHTHLNAKVVARRVYACGSMRHDSAMAAQRTRYHRGDLGRC